jgi:uncharacterized protein
MQMPDAALCVTCRQRPAEPPFRPFCSERCRLIDLGRWLSEDYRVPGPTDEPERIEDRDPD